MLLEEYKMAIEFNVNTVLGAGGSSSGGGY